MLSQRLNIPHYDLDDFFWDNEAEAYGVKASEKQRDQKLKEFVSHDSWIIEGVYRSWVEPSFSAADKIIALIPPVSLQETRIWKRYEDRVSGTDKCEMCETLNGVRNLLAWNAKYNLEKLPHFIKNCEYKDKIITVTDNLDVIELLCN
ncbi:hypothetical protein [Paenibacillus sp. IHBB 3054]|uniref:hypothetical protein n=1 Tax=Paenibacillus sp. IHBB 3054 TaxID=3425689 RepID=UPI003F676604